MKTLFLSTETWLTFPKLEKRLVREDVIERVDCWERDEGKWGTNKVLCSPTSILQK